ncbi:hypothetical protein CC80DRAFT_498750 [Byssothecium circinans]|uniref:DUF3824 domain-containing protein n=1 Tax=Byssothecium circinans TaxID=147558 RepID=A0A6A5UFB6_9PLEO|nr:hypothetical protein CC80DRAFT_498750 [Byssothecium circinans]
MSTVFRAERERDYEASSHGGGRSYTTVKRYKIPDHSLEEDVYESEMRLVHRPREPVEERREVREYVVERDDPRDREVREYRFVEREVERSPSPVRREIREYHIEREVERSPSPPVTREYRQVYEREREAPRETPYGELERYSRSTEYFRPEQPAPQPIIIRNEAPQPIIVQESAPQQIIVRREEPSYEIVERAEVTQDRQIARREPRRDEDYYYERKIKEVDRGGRWEQDYYDEREYGRGRYRDRDAYSDDDVVYVHKEKDTWGRDSSPNHKRHLAEGVIAGVGAAELMRHHRKKQGEDPGHHVRQAVGYGALGAVGAEVVSRVRNRSRSSSYERDPRGRRHHRSRSSSRVKKVGTLAALAGIGALAYVAGRKNTTKTTVIEDRRSRSRHRKSSVSRAISGSRGRSSSRPASESALDPEHRNRKVAQVGLASAAVAGLVEHQRNKSRGRKGGRSRSRVRQGIPIAAAGAAGAAVTGLYERHKAKKEAKETSRSRSRPKSVHSRSKRGSTVSDTGLVEYGGDPIYSDPAVGRPSRDYDDPADHRNRRRSRRRSSSSSSDGRRHRHRSRSSRSRSKSRTRQAAETAAVAGVAGLAAHEAAKRRDRRKAEKERQRREEDSAYSTGSYSPPPTTFDSTDPRYFPQTNYFPPPPHQPVDTQYPPYNPADYQEHPSNHINMPPPTGYTPPPEPGNPYAHRDPRYRRPDDNVSAQPHEPAPALASTHPPLLEQMHTRGGSRLSSDHPYDNLHVSLANGVHLADRLRPSISEPIRNGYVPHYQQSYSPVHAVPVNNYATAPPRAPAPAHLGTVNTPSSPINHSPIPHSPIAPDPVAPSSAKSVQFDLTPQELSPERHSSSTNKREKDEDKWRDSSDSEPRRSRHRKRDPDRDRQGEDGKGGRERRKRRDGSPDSISSSETIELPPRFDETGRPKDDDPLATQLESVLAGLFK